MQVFLKQLADEVGGSILGDGDIAIHGVAGIREARPGEITFLTHPKYMKDLDNTSASAVILSRTTPGQTVESLKSRPFSLLLVDEPYYIFSRVMQRFHSRPFHPAGISPQASLGHAIELGKDLSIHPFVRIEDHSRIRDRVTLGVGTFVGEGAEIGEDCSIHPNVTIREGVVIGKRVIIHSGAVIGSDGYGFATRDGKHHKIPQVGTVVIGDDVEIGANTTIDRATLGQTMIGRGTKIDNQVQIGHNVVIGEDCLIVAQVGIAGSTKIGNHVVLAGQVGVIDHLNIGDGARVGAVSGVFQDVPSGATVSGTPAIPQKNWLRVQAVFKELPVLKQSINKLKKKIETLQKLLSKKG